VSRIWSFGKATEAQAPPEEPEQALEQKPELESKQEPEKEIPETVAKTKRKSLFFLVSELLI